MNEAKQRIQCLEWKRKRMKWQYRNNCIYFLFIFASIFTLAVHRMRNQTFYKLLEYRIAWARETFSIVYSKYKKQYQIDERKTNNNSTHSKSTITFCKCWPNTRLNPYRYVFFCFVPFFNKWHNVCLCKMPFNYIGNTDAEICLTVIVSANT